jgi:hypothetical protein
VAIQTNRGISAKPVSGRARKIFSSPFERTRQVGGLNLINSLTRREHPVGAADSLSSERFHIVAEQFRRRLLPKSNKEEALSKPGIVGNCF